MKPCIRIALLALILFPVALYSATFTVINTNSSGAGSLQQALFDANTNAGVDTISFNIASGGLTITPTNALPSIAEPVTINGRSQPGFVSVPIIELNGASAGAAVDGLKINTSNCVISALVINRFLGDQIEITNGASNVIEGCYLGLNLAGTVDASTGLNGILITNAANSIIGGLGATNRNFISGNNQSGIAIGGATSTSNSILGNVIGLNITNNAVANSADGIRVNAPFTIIGGNTTAARNIISGNTGDGIESAAPLGTNCVIRGNWIGVDTNGVLDRGNTVNGILAAAGASVIGGSGPGEGNLITGNNGDGIQLNGASSTNHLVLGNVIGSTSAFAAVVINSGNGILITTSSRSNVIGGILAGEANTIYFNGGDGIGVAAANANTNNAFRGNLLFGNTASGIDLGAAGITVNDNGDADVGANQLQNFPVLTSVSNTATAVFITGTLNSRPSTTYGIDFYSSIEADTGLNGEGQFYIGSTNLATGADSNLAFTVSFPVVLQGRHVSATATDPSGNTSEFSAAPASVSFALAQTFTVVNTNDSGAGSLREAINQANLAATTGGDTIQFAITNLSRTITPSSELPAITDGVTIDGYTQPGAAVNTSATTFNGTVLVPIAGASAGSGANGITITTSNCTVRGLMITGFVSTGADGIEISGGSNNLIEGCLIGIDSNGTDQGNGANGVFISDSPNNVIGGTTPAARNVISGNQSDGVEINGASATGNQILGNLIGTGLTGIGSVPNSADGVLVTVAGANVIGGSTSGAGNLISGNSNDGIELTGASTTNTIVLGNRIGTEVTGSSALANSVHGVNINTSSRSNIVGGVLSGYANTIAFNGQDGINVAAAAANTNNTFRGNSIFSNGSVSGELGIDLGAAGVQANDLGDADTGANQLQNFPVLAWVTNTPGGTVFSGSLNSRPSLTYTIDFYANTDVDTDGTGEGKYYLGSTNLTTAADSNVIFTVSLPVVALPGRYVSATATDPFGNTSEFATNVFAQSTLTGTTFLVVNTNDSGAGSLRQAILDANANISAGDTIAFAITNLSTTISPSSALQTIIDPVNIDGYTQPGTAVNTAATIFNGTVLVRITGASAGSGANGLTITAGNSTVRGLMITGFIGAGDGVEISGGGGNVIEGCLIGIDAAGADAGNAANGILISNSANNLVGGTTPASRNVISGNNSDGVEILGVASTGNKILGNIIGADQSGTVDVGNSADGVFVSGAGGAIIGGTNSGAGNLISGNNSDGIELNGVSTTNTVVLGNRIGTEVTGAATLGNSVHGVFITTSSRSNLIGGVLTGQGNTIAFNGQDGINVAAATSNTNNTFRGNAIFSNGTTTGELGIDLGADGILANDAGDPDAGANQLQNFPVLTAVTNTPAGTEFYGSLNSQPSTTYTIDFYANVAADTAGIGEGQYYIGSTNLTTAADSNVTFAVSLPVVSLSGRYISATATDPFGNTSELSTNVFAYSTVSGSIFTVLNTNDSGAGSLRQAILDANAVISSGDTIVFAITNPASTISPTSALPTIIERVTIDGYTQSGAALNSSASGFNGVLPVVLSGTAAGAGVDGLRFTLGGNTVRGLNIINFTQDGVEFTGGSFNSVEGCIIGLDAGSVDHGNTADGVRITGSSENRIGGSTLAARNVISGNGGDGIEINGVGSSNNIVVGNLLGTDLTGILDRGNSDGILITTAPYNRIGGTNSTERNIISGNSYGIFVQTAGATNNLIVGNFLGTDFSGTLDLGNDNEGVYISGVSGNIIGTAGAGNLISGNGGDGIEINGANGIANIVQGNKIGTDFTGTVDLGNGNNGVLVSSGGSGNIIGGATAAEGNLISGNNSDGVELNGSTVAGNLVRNNRIGTDSAGTAALGNGGHGVLIATSAHDNQIGGSGNTIAFNGGDGVFVNAGINNAIRQNLVFNNAGLGIDLFPDGISINDATDADTGANQLQNFPVLSGATNLLAGVTIGGSLDSGVGTTYAIDFFSNSTNDLSGAGEGQFYLGSTNVTTDGAGHVNFVVSFPTMLTGRYVTATATDPLGNTSEFGTNVFATSTVPGLTLIVTNTANSGAGSLREAITQANAAITTGDIITFNIPGAGVQIISPTSALPPITDPLTINGYSQPGASANTLSNGHNAVLRVRLDGALAGIGTDGLLIATRDSIVQGLAIGGFGGDGIEINNGLSNRVEGCYLGLDPDGSTRRGNTGNGVNIVSGSTGNTVGGDTPAARCIVSANNRGVVLSSVTFSSIKGSRIGTDATGNLALGNTNSGVLISGNTARLNTVGGVTGGARNVISGNGVNFTSEGHGISLSQCLSNSILGNYIGTTANGSAALGNQDNGISLESGASTNFIGGSFLGAGNVISANNIGIDFSSFSPDQIGNFVQGNLIGTDTAGTADLGNLSHGLSFSFADFNQIGGTAAGARNVISGNNGNGVNVNCCAAASNVFEGNFIGVAINGTTPLGNGGDGVFNGSPGTRIGGVVAGAGNIIANNGSDGVIHFISTHYSVAILGNSIYSNGSLGIELGLDNAPTPNDPGDTDEGANHFQNFPVITSALQYPSNTVITASLNSRSNTTYRVELFDNASADPSGFGEGQTYLGFTNVTTDSAGNVAFSVTNGTSLPFGHYISATATDPTNNTSEFSAVRKVVPFDSVDLNLVIADSDDPASRSTNHFYTLYVTNAGPANATSVFVTNMLPAGLVYVTATTSQGSASHTAGVVTCNLGIITNGGFATVLLQVTATNTGSFVDQALVVAAGQLDNETNYNSDAESTFFGIADIAVSITDLPDPIVAGQILTNIVVVTNRGPDAATFVNGSFDLAFNAVPTAASVSQGSYVQSGNNFSFSPGTIPAGGSAVLTIRGVPIESGLITHFASASGAEADFVSTNNNANASTTVIDGAGVLQFFTTTFNASENNPQGFVFVKRTGGAIGNVAAGYSTANGSATAGLDYSNTVGMISFTNGETLKTFTVPIINDVLFECNEFLNVSLHSPTGGLVLIGLTQAVVNIIENDLTPGGNVRAVSGSTNLLPGASGNDNSFQSSVSADGRYVTFSSHASNLSPDDDNFNQDVFVRDLLAQTTTLVSYDQNGSSSGNGSSQNAIIGGNGRYVVFDSFANNLEPNDDNGNRDVFVRDLLTGDTTLVSINTAGTNSGNNASFSSDPTRALISSNGQWIAYTSYASDLNNIPKFNGIQDVFLFDRVAGTNRLISVNLTGTAAGNAESFDPVISANGQVVVFTSSASDLVSNDANANSDVFWRDLTTGVTELVSRNLAGTGSGNNFSESAYPNADGRYVAFASVASNMVTNDSNSNMDVLWRDRVAGVTVLVSVSTNASAPGNSSSTVHGISADGRYVVFSSFANNLVPGDGNFSEDVFVRDMFSNVTMLVSKTFFGSDPGNNASRNPVISGDGTHVAFESYATDLTPATKVGFYSDIFVRNLTNNTMRLVSFRNGDTNGPNGNSFDAAISFKGNVTAFTGDAEGGGGGEGLMLVNGSINYSDVWAHTYASNTTELVSASVPSQTGSGVSFSPQVSRDGQWVAFVSSADNLVTNDVNGAEDIFVMNLASSAIALVSANITNGPGNGYSSSPSISTNGNYVAFASYASDLVAGDDNFTTDVFVRDRVAGTNILASVNFGGSNSGNSYSQNPALSQDGRYVAFESSATDLTAVLDTNFNTDVFLRDRVTGITTLVSRNVTGTSSGNGGSYNPVIEVDPVSGKVYVAYLSSAGNLVNNDTNNIQDVFLYDVTAASNHLASVNVAGNGSGNDYCYNPQLAVGNASSNVVVVYSSVASNLVSNDTNSTEDVFVYKLSTGVNELVSVNQSGTGSGDSYSYSPTVSADGRYVVFASAAANLASGDTNSQPDIFLRDRQTSVTTLITRNCDASSSANGDSFNPVISADGRYVSYVSSAKDLLPGNFTSFAENIFRYDRQLGSTTLISQNVNLTGGANANSYDNRISANGGTIAFASDASNLVLTDANNNTDIFVWQAGAVTPLPDLVLDKSASTNTIPQSGSFSYTLTVTNVGSSSATGVNITDNLPAGVSFVSATATQGTVTNSGNTVTASVVSLAFNEGARITINVTAVIAGSVSNYASSVAFQADTTPANNSDFAIVTVTPSTLPTLSIQPTNSTQLFVSWPASTPSGFVLETATNLVPVIVWSTVTNSVSISGTNKFVILNVNAAEPERYYRLKQ